MKSFDVLDKPWIPVVYIDGRVTEVGIRECLFDADKIKTLSNRYPYEKIAMLRFLTAFVTDAYQLKNRIAREQLYNVGHFDSVVIERYISDCISGHGASFDLFDEKRPFMSFAYNPENDTDETKRSAAYLHLNLPHGKNDTHIVAQREEDFKGDQPAELLRALLSFYLYPTGNLIKGANSNTGANCYIVRRDETGKPVYSAAYGSMGVNAGPSMAGFVPVFYWPENDTLFHTLVMCMRSERELGNLPLNDPPAPWNTDKVLNPKRGKRGEVVPKVSYVSGLTFQPRRVVFEVSGDVIRECWITNGYVNPDDKLWHDPFAVRLKNHKTNELFYSKPNMDRSMWRDVGNLTAGKKESWHIMPDVLQPVSPVLDEHLYENISSLLMDPMTQNAGYDGMIYDDTVRLPVGFMENEVLGSYLTGCLELIESASGCWDEIKLNKLLDTRGMDNGMYYTDALNEYWERMHRFLFDGKDSFLNQITEEYEKDQENFAVTLDERLIDFMIKTIRNICAKEEASAGSWDSMVAIISHTRGKGCVINKFKTKIKKIRNGEEVAK